ncbi:hypothetical protein CRE_17305 [Caenorhabditis remanei]|uniref:Protein kinase domain-containing protein n=1 Tax=Caenorhabditis remanei TaxID=31234 RepID=E3MS15_CAERE|nr:hypothetical protein CRE_17305 [Caenorhabditis remanei]
MGRERDFKIFNSHSTSNQKMKAQDINEDKKEFQLHVGEKICQGTFSSTFLATTVPDMSGNYSEVAKVGLKKNQNKYAKEQQILREVNGHKYFPRFVYAGESPKFTYIVTEFAGEDLKTVSERNRNGLLSNENLLRLAHKLHGAVGFLHTKGFFDRDVQAANGLIDLKNKSVRVKLCDFGDSTEINQPARRRSSFMRLFHRQDVPPYHPSEDHCHTAVLCLKLLVKMPDMTRRESIFYNSHITKFEFPELVEEHTWIKLIWLSLCGCYENKETNFSFIATFLDAAIVGFDKRTDLDYNIKVGVKICDFGDSSEIKEPERRRSSFFNFFLRPVLPPFHESKDHCYTAILCLKLLTKIPHSSRRKSFFSTTHIEHDWIKLNWMSLCACYTQKSYDFSFIRTFLDSAITGFCKRSELEYETEDRQLKLL